MKIYFIVCISFLFSIDMETYGSINNKNINSINNNQNGNYSNVSSFKNSQVLNSFITEETYITGPGDVYLFNMIANSRIINLELIVSPSGDILIPVVGTVNVKNKNIKDVYKIIIDKCKEKYEDAYVYINLIRLRSFKVLITGNIFNSGMYVVSSTDKVSDLIESMFESNIAKSNTSFPNSITMADSLLFSHLSNYPRNILFNKDVFLTRNDSIINVDLFDYYMFSQTDSNPELQEGDIINIKESNKIAILGEIKNPKRVELEKNLTYRKLIKLAGGLKATGDESSIKIVNYNSLLKTTRSEINRISKIDSRYRSDYDESFLSSRLRSDKGVLYINNYKNLQKFLDTKISSGDIIVIPHKVDYIELIGGLSMPGTYKYNSLMNMKDYLLLAGGFSEEAKKNNIYLIDNISGFKSKINNSYIPKAGDVIFIEEKVGYKSWERFSESIKLGGTLSTMLLVFYNIWDKLDDESDN